MTDFHASSAPPEIRELGREVRRRYPVHSPEEITAGTHDPRRVNFHLGTEPALPPEDQGRVPLPLHNQYHPDRMASPEELTRLLGISSYDAKRVCTELVLEDIRSRMRGTHKQWCAIIRWTSGPCDESGQLVQTVLGRVDLDSTHYERLLAHMRAAHVNPDLNRAIEDALHAAGLTDAQVKERRAFLLSAHEIDDRSVQQRRDALIAEVRAKHPGAH